MKCWLPLPIGRRKQRQSRRANLCCCRRDQVMITETGIGVTNICDGPVVPVLLQSINRVHSHEGHGNLSADGHFYPFFILPVFYLWYIRREWFADNHGWFTNKLRMFDGNFPRLSFWIFQKDGARMNRLHGHSRVFDEWNTDIWWIIADYCRYNTDKADLSVFYPYFIRRVCVTGLFKKMKDRQKGRRTNENE